MDRTIEQAAEEIGMFCRMQLYSKKELPIRSSEMGLLIFISKQQEEVTPLKISQFFKIAKPSVTSMVNELLKREYLVKQPSPSDGRSYSLVLTEKGKKLVIAARDEYFKDIALLEEKMGVMEFTQLIDSLKKANRLLSEERQG